MATVRGLLPMRTASSQLPQGRGSDLKGQLYVTCLPQKNNLLKCAAD